MVLKVNKKYLKWQICNELQPTRNLHILLETACVCMNICLNVHVHVHCVMGRRLLWSRDDLHLGDNFYYYFIANVSSKNYLEKSVWLAPSIVWYITSPLFKRKILSICNWFGKKNTTKSKKKNWTKTGTESPLEQVINELSCYMKKKISL